MVVVAVPRRYEVAGEVFLPEHLATTSPSSAVQPPAQPSAAAPPTPQPASSQPPTATATPAAPGPNGQQGGAASAGEADAGGAAVAGRWRLAVHVPAACIQDLLPAAQLVSATQQPGRDYASAKASFLTALDAAGMRVAVPAALGLPPTSPGVASPLGAGGAGDPLMGSAGPQEGQAGAGRAGVGAAGAGAGGGGGVLPALQELSGLWSGSIQMWGDSQGASNVEFNLKGREWRCVVGPLRGGANGTPKCSRVP